MWKPGTKAPPPRGSVLPKKVDAAPVKMAMDGAPKAPKPALSHKTLAMKFMQRKNQAALTKAEVQQDEWADAKEDGESSGELTCIRDLPDPSMDKKLGRRSFGGFNGSIEDVHKVLKSNKRFEEANDRALKDEVSAEEMADRYVTADKVQRMC
ncbi:hypothetical protein, variant [Aphanomyces invadans]|uniref:Uncharacterized protein n=1 Tax=Aphanomyces invadans TaxID=157072 RepID=A0A024TBP0_9STRA|nr:hypothetical protein, variant [Aphanomyces invadans]ETV91585.1 hypothetical protein, variant [Aphanomyces invadans]|eukprot:XP_008879852.1 hypothetical protein, variant [Aphanomyces invadans]